MSLDNYLKKKSFLIYGLGLTGVSVVKFFNRNKIKNYYVWDDIKNKLYKSKRPKNIYKVLKKVDYIILSPGINLRKSKNKKKLIKFKKKIITDIDLIYLFKKDFKSIVVTGTNGKSTTCKIIDHVLKKNKFKTLLGGNIGKPILDFKIKKYNYVIIEASSFQLAYSKFIRPDHAILLNIANDHLDWHGNMRNYINSKFKIFALQKKSQYSFVNKNLQNNFINRKLSGKLIIPRMQDYNRIKNKVKNDYIKTNINNENMSNVVALAKILKIKEKSFITSLNSFKGLPHRYEVFLKKKNIVFINDSKATTFEATKPALQNTKNIYWILGGLPKKNDKIILKNFRKNIVKAYVIGKSVNYFKKQISNKINFTISKNLKRSIIQILKDINLFHKENIHVLLSPAAASYDQFLNFEKRGEEFKKLIRYYAQKYI